MSTKSTARPDSAKVLPLTTKPANITKLLQRYGTGAIPFAGTEYALYDRHLVFDRAIDPKVASARERFEAVSHGVRDILAQRWVQTKMTYEQENAKRIYYLSMEFLLGRSLTNNIANLMVDPVVQEVIKVKGIDWPELIEQEPDAGLGNGGLGRLAACFLDSMATMQLPGTGYGSRYEYGMFRQSFVNGWQQENPDNWLRDGDPWEICRRHEKVDIKLNVTFKLRDGRVELIPGRPSTLFGIPFDRPVVGYGGKTINTLRLWAAAAADFFDLQEFGTGDFVGALGGTLEAESLTRVLYPDDSTSEGQQLRFLQEYFLVACSLADLIRRFLRHNNDWGKLPEKAVIQLNDTHPSMAVAELMRILLDDAHLGWDEAWDLTKKTLAYTNHTLLPEALEKWPVAWFEVLLPRQLEIIYEVNRRLLDEVRARFPNDEGRVERISLVEEGSSRKIRMANLAIVGSHSTNGVAAVHSKLLRATTVKDLAEMFPERFNNKTNGVTPRRWLLESNPSLASVITSAIGEKWITDLSQLLDLKPHWPQIPPFGKSFWQRSGKQKCVSRIGLRQRLDKSLIPTRFSTVRSSASMNINGNF
jgi:glycogen phosphorylase